MQLHVTLNMFHLNENFALHRIASKRKRKRYLFYTTQRNEQLALYTMARLVRMRYIFFSHQTLLHEIQPAVIRQSIDNSEFRRCDSEHLLVLFCIYINNVCGSRKLNCLQKLC